MASVRVFGPGGRPPPVPVVAPGRGRRPGRLLGGKGEPWGNCSQAPRVCHHAWMALAGGMPLHQGFLQPHLGNGASFLPWSIPQGFGEAQARQQLWKQFREWGRGWERGRPLPVIPRDPKRGTMCLRSVFGPPPPEGSVFPQCLILFLLEAVELPQHYPHRIHFSWPGPKRGALCQAWKRTLNHLCPK